MLGETGEPVVTTLVCFILFAREAAGAAGTRHSLRPLFSRDKFRAQLGRIAPQDGGRTSRFDVIARSQRVARMRAR